MHCTWRFRDNGGNSEPEGLAAWADELNISPFLARLLWRRGLDSREAMDVFLGPHLRHLPPLEGWPELIRAAEHLARELEQGKTLAVWGDYDVDGITAAAVAVDFLRRRGYKVLTRLPHRMEEGYGLNAAGLEELAAQGVGCLLTVDCGISDLEAAERARELGLSLVITDHHASQGELPRADHVVNPRLQDTPYSQVAGVGVAWLLMAALNRLLPGPADDIRRYLDFVALGTIADVVRLTPENRILVKNGLLLLGEAKRPGIFALKEVSRIPPTSSLGSGQVGFSLAPRINAAGRMGSPEAALDLLLAPDLSTARPLAAKLESFNQKRRSEEESILGEALEQAEAQKDAPGLVLYSPQWHQGVIGIVASRVAERYHRPVLLLSREGERLKGSGRSIPEFDLFQGLVDCGGTLLGYGGHPQAAGLSLSEDRLDDLKAAFAAAVRSQLGETLPEPSLQLEARLGLESVDLQLIKEIDLLQPFGPGNPQPLFCSNPLAVKKHKVFGGKHVSLEVRDESAGKTMLGKAWRQVEHLGSGIAGKNVRLAFTPRLNTYNGLISIDLHIRDWEICS